MKRTKRTLFFLYLLGVTCASMAQADPIIMRIDGEPITRGEFEYNYNKNNAEGVMEKKSVEEYMNMFINYKLKVRAAKEAKLDTLSSFRNEFRTYRDMQILPLLVPKTRMEEECRIYYNRMKDNLQGKDIIQPAHIFLRVRQDADSQKQTAIKERIDSIYQALKDGADFSELAKKFSEDKASATKGGSLPWIGPNQTLKEFEDVAYAMKTGEISEPFLSTVGYHIVKILGRKELEPYEELRPNIARYLESRGMKDQLAAQAVDSIATKNGKDKSVEQILDEETERLCTENSELKHLIQEYHDGLLFYEICNREVWTPARKDTSGMESYFSKNKKKYAWKEPHYSGMIYYCVHEKDIKAVRKALKRVKPALWIGTIREKFNQDSITVLMDKRLFKKGDNQNVDILGLKVKHKKMEPKEGFPFIGIIGKRLKKGPKEWTDVQAEVAADYQRHCENIFVQELRHKYKVEVYENILKTINKH